MSSYDLSVVMRSGSVNAWLDEAVRSVLASVDVNLELILVLNGPQIAVSAEEISKEEETYGWLTDSRVTVLRYDHYLGVSGSMVEGIRRAKAPFVANVDGDDVVLPEKFARQLDYLNTHEDCVLVGTRTRRINDAGEVTGDIPGESGDDVRQKLLLFNVVPHSSIVFRKSAHDQVGGYRYHLDQYEDYDFILRIARLGKVALLDDFLVLYRVHQTNISKGSIPTGLYIQAVASGRRALASKLGVSPVVAWPQHALWRTVQFARAAGLIRALHEY